MKLSQFTVVVNDYPETDQHLLYNTLSRALIQVDKAEWDVLQNLSTDLPIENQSRALLKPLRDQGFLVPKEIKEGQRFLESLNQSSDQKGGASQRHVIDEPAALPPSVRILLPAGNARRGTFGGRSFGRMPCIYQRAVRKGGGRTSLY